MAETTSSVSTSTIEPLDDRASAVRFQTQCVVIPDPEHRSRRPRVVTKSYSLPLWKRRPSPGCLPTSALPEDTSSEEQQPQLVLRVPLPTFSRKHSPTVRSVDHPPLSPCLVHRAPPSGPSCAPARHSRAPRKSSPSPSRSDVVTIPLRPCCIACQPITEAAVASGDAWPEHFSRAASRRRSSSADASPRTITVAGSSASTSYGHLGIAITVDEVDKRRRSSDTGLSTSSWETPPGDLDAKADYRVPLILRRTAPPSFSTDDADLPPSPTCTAPTTPRIPEEEDDEDEDENELFPLPSPKRTPTPTPAPSPEGSLSSLMVAQANQGSAVSPTPSNCSGDSTGPTPSKRHFLAPPACSSSSLSLPKLSESTTDLTLAEDSPRAPSPSLLSTLPTLSGRLRSQPSSPRISFIPSTPIDALISTPDNIPPKSIAMSVPIAIPSASQLSTSPHRSPTHMRFPWRLKRSVSSDISLAPSSATPSCSPTISSTLSNSPSSKKSFSMSSPRNVFSDVLRGVGAMGVSGVRPGM